MKQLSVTLQNLANQDHSVFAASDLAGAVPDCSQLSVLLSRVTAAGVLERVCRGIYFYPHANYPIENLLYHSAARLRAGEFNYLSLESILSEFGVISQIPFNWISLMTSGRSHIVNCGKYGHIEFVHTAQLPAEVGPQLTFDPVRRLWVASVRQAMRDIKATHRSQELINREILNELV